MNYANFLLALAHTPRDWRVTKTGRIRRANSQCPISSLSDLSVGWYDIVATQHGIPRGVACLIANSADGFSYDMIREDLLKACGLEPHTRV